MPSSNYPQNKEKKRENHCETESLLFLIQWRQRNTVRFSIVTLPNSAPNDAQTGGYTKTAEQRFTVKKLLFRVRDMICFFKCLVASPTNRSHAICFIILSSQSDLIALFVFSHSFYFVLFFGLRKVYIHSWFQGGVSKFGARNTNRKNGNRCK